MSLRQRIFVSIRYFIVQFLGYGIDIGGFLLLYEVWGLPPLAANLICKPLAAAFAFYFHRIFTFRVKGGPDLHWQIVRYIIVLLVNLQASSLLLVVLQRLHLPVTAAKVSADIICVGLTFLLMRYLVFRRATGAAGK